MNILFNLCLIFAIGFVKSASEPNIYAPVIVSKYTNKRGIPLFRGEIHEDETTVTLDPQITAYDNDTVGSARLICRYEIATSRRNIPFVIELKDRLTGAAEIKLEEGKTLNYHKRKHYKFNVFAFDCVDPPYDKRSKRAVVVITVHDVDKFAPVFDKMSYFIEMEEGKLYDSLLKIEAHDGDESEEYSKICGYEIQTDDVPFIIDNEGNLKNTKVVQYSERYNFILKVVARDCGGRESSPIFVNIQVTEICKNGWRGFPEHIEYTPGSGRKRLAETAHLDICDESCKPDHISVRMTLATKHIGKGCDRDTYSITSQRKLCGASDDSIDLLPLPTLTSNWTNSLPTDDGHDGDQIYGFDGRTNAVVVPEGHADHRLREHFTISTWMKHTFPMTIESHHKNGNKEHIMCMSDGEGMNRHHYAFLIHNQKLVFILRRESEDASDLEVFKPAEWRWNLAQIMDGDWHHYAVSVDFPEVHLYVDGKMFVPDEDNMETLDDWPLHPTDRVHFTKLTIGACWRGLDEKFDGYFQGYLAGLTLLKDKTESDRVIKCLNNCQENLDFHALSEMHSGTSVSFNSEMTEFSITGSNATEIENLVREVAYVNARSFPTPGRRNLNIRTNIHCGNVEEILPLVESYIFVEHSNKPVITISGRPVITGSHDDFKTGIDILRDINIRVDFHVPPADIDESSEDSEEVVDNFTSELKKARLEYKLSKTTLIQETAAKNDQSNGMLLDMCSIRAEPVLNFYVEHIDLPKDVIKEFNMKLEGIETAAGLVILNADTIKNYITVLKNIRYTHTETEKLQSRKFVISCSSQSARFVSNEFEVEIAPYRKEPLTIVRAHAQNDQMAQSVLEPQMQQQLSHSGSYNSTNFGMVAIIVVCVGFLLFMIVLGVLRIRAAHNRTRVLQVDEKQEMEWDNSELNITVNPIDQELFEYEENPLKATTFRDESDTDDDASSCFHDDDEPDSSEDEEETRKKTLEWDDSTLSY